MVRSPARGASDEFKVANNVIAKAYYNKFINQLFLRYPHLVCTVQVDACIRCANTISGFVTYSIQTEHMQPIAYYGSCSYRDLNEFATLQHRLGYVMGGSNEIPSPSFERPLRPISKLYIYTYNFIYSSVDLYIRTVQYMYIQFSRFHGVIYGSCLRG